MANKDKPAIYRPGFEIKSPAMKKVYAEVAAYAFHRRPCVLFGESGVGKEYVARYYYQELIKGSGDKSKVPLKILNCAGLSDGTMAHSILFGHVKGAFTGADRDKAGIFEEAKGGLLFLDEVGEITSDVQPVLFRALDSETHEAHRLNSSEIYSTKDVTVICATEKPDMRTALIARLDKQIFIPGIDKRPEDIEPAVLYFARLALTKRRDVSSVMQALCRNFYAQGTKDLMDEPEVISLAEDIAEKLLPIAATNVWKGNFRELRGVVDTAVILSRYEYGKDLFLKDAVREFKSHLFGGGETSSLTVTENNNETDRDILDMLHKALPISVKDSEKNSIAAFLSSRKGRSFSRSELAEVLPHIKDRAVQNRLKSIEDAGGIIRSGKRGDRYSLAPRLCDEPQLKSVVSKFLSLPSGTSWPKGRQKELDTLHGLLKQSRGVFIGGDPGSGRTSCALALGEELSQARGVYYYQIDSGGLSKMLELIDKWLKNSGAINNFVISSDGYDAPSLHAAALSGYIRAVFTNRPVFIIDNADLLTNTEQHEGLTTLVRYWKDTTFVIVGRKLGHDLEYQGVVEYRINPFDKE